jgi:hypothetical protein
MKPTVIVNLIDGECEVSRKKGECYVIRVDHDTESVVAPSELLKMIRYNQRQEQKKASTTAGDK